MEKVNLKRRHSQAKVIGAVVMVVGAVIMILYKGPIVPFAWSKGRTHGSSSAAAEIGHGNFLIGTLSLIASCICWSGFYILQVMIRYAPQITTMK